MKSIIAKLVSTRKSSKLFADNPQSIILKPIGDALIHLIHFSQLKRAYPQLRIGVIVTERNRILFEHSPYVDSLSKKPIKYGISRIKLNCY